MLKKGITPKSVWPLIYLSVLVLPLLWPLHGQSGGVVYYADHVLHNGKIVTVDGEFTIAEALAIRDGKVVEVGSNQEALRHAGPQTKVIDLQERTVLPGLYLGPEFSTQVSPMLN
jgi:hypothetical protein